MGDLSNGIVDYFINDTVYLREGLSLNPCRFTIAFVSPYGKKLEEFIFYCCCEYCIKGKQLGVLFMGSCIHSSLVYVFLSRLKSSIWNLHIRLMKLIELIWYSLIKLI